MSNGYGYTDGKGRVIETLSHLAPGDENLGAHLVSMYDLRDCENRAFSRDGDYPCGYEPSVWRDQYVSPGYRSPVRYGSEHGLYHRLDINGTRLKNCTTHDFPEDDSRCRNCGLTYSDLYGKMG